MFFIFKGTTPPVPFSAHQLPFLSHEGFTISQFKEGLVSSLCLPSCLPGLAPLFPEAVDPHSATTVGFALSQLLLPLSMAAPALAGASLAGRTDLQGCVRLGSFPFPQHNQDFA